MSKNFGIPCLIFSSLLLQVIGYQVRVTVNNNSTDPGGRRRFDTDVGKEYTIKILRDEIVPFIWKVFQQPTDAARKNVPVVNVIITKLTGALGQIGENNIYVSDVGVRDFPPGRDQARFWYKSLLYHEAAHIYQWNGEGSCPGGLTEGTADYIMVKSKVYDPNTYTKPGSGNRWDEGYGVTEKFLEYCDSLKPGFTPMFNNKMRKVFKEEYFKELLGKPLNQLWQEYKSKYKKKINVPCTTKIIQCN